MKYPNVTVKLVGEDGNAFFIVARVRKALQRAGVAKDEIEEFTNEAMSGDYHHLIDTVMNTVNVE